MQVFVDAFVEQGLVMSLERTADERLIYLYENIRQNTDSRRSHRPPGRLSAWRRHNQTTVEPPANPMAVVQSDGATGHSNQASRQPLQQAQDVDRLDVRAEGNQHA
jgi:hypothetical protein